MSGVGAKSFRDLKVYQSAREGTLSVFSMTLMFPKEERYSLTDQVRRSSRAVNAMIAEAWGRRIYKAAFINKLNEAMSEAMETRSWLDQALDCAYLTTSDFEALDARYASICAMLWKMISLASEFCLEVPESSSKVSEDPETEYLILSTSYLAPTT